MKHTPGPWITDDGDSRVWGVFSAADRQAICYTSAGSDPLRPEDEANARLIAAAPEVMEALKGILHNDCRYWRDAARAAIAKAEAQ